MIATIATALAWLISIAVVLMGAGYIWAPGRAAGFGIPETPIGDAAFLSWVRVKGNRDIGAGLLLILVLVGGTPQLLGAAMIVAAIMPICDAITVLRAGGTPAMIYGVHLATAVAMVIVGLALLVT